MRPLQEDASSVVSPYCTRQHAGPASQLRQLQLHSKRLGSHCYSHKIKANTMTMKSMKALLLLACSAEAFAPTRTAFHRLSATSLREADIDQVEVVAAGEETTASSPSKKYVVVGGGWGGWGAAKALCERYVVICFANSADCC